MPQHSQNRQPHRETLSGCTMHQMDLTPLDFININVFSGKQIVHNIYADNEREKNAYYTD